MSAPSWEEMEAKRQEMITSFKDIASAMTRCVVIIEDYTRLSPSTLMDVAKPTITGTPPSEVKKERKARVVKEKDPNAPKRPPSAYLLFQNDVKDEIRKTHADIPYKDVLQVISAKWKELPPDQKKVYEEAYHDAEATFRLDQASYVKDAALVPVVPLPTLQAATEGVSDDSESDETSDTSDTDSPPVPAVNVSASKSKPTIPATTSVTLPTPQTINPAAVIAKKEKKRKNKEDEAAVAATLEPSGEKKQRKKKKEVPVA